MKLNDFRIASRLGFGFGAVALMLLAVALTGIVAFSHIQDSLHEIVGKRMPAQAMAGKWVAAVLQSARHTRNMLILDDHDKIRAEVDAVRKDQRERSGYLAHFKEITHSAEGMRLLATVEEKRDAYLGPENAYLQLVEQGRLADARKLLLESVRPLQLTFLDTVYALAEFEERRGSEAGAGALAACASAFGWMLALSAAALLLAGAIAWLIARSIVRPLDAAVAVAGQVAQGDLSRPVTVHGKDEIAVLLRALADMQGSLRKVIGETRQYAGQLASASREYTATAEKVAAGSLAQSDSASSMAAAVEELTVSVSHISDASRDAKGATVESRQCCLEGSGVIDSAATKVRQIADDISASAESVQHLRRESEAITNVVKVIREVSDQTNLLALNAAIEAARAGEQGRGFAVVADEVRKLAERTQGSTQEIGNLIGRIQDQTRQVFEAMQNSAAVAHQGVELSRSASVAIERINQHSGTVEGVVGDIAASLQEQSGASTEIARQVERIAQMAEENRHAIDGVRRAAADLAQLADTLNSSVSRFVL